MNVTTKLVTQSIADVFALQRAHALALRRSTAAPRIALLKRLEAALLKAAPEIYKALRADLHKPEAEADLAELMPVFSEIRHAVRHLRAWMRPQKILPTKTMLGTSARIRFEPRGVALIIAPWNYPISLTLGPLVSAIAAGCTAMVKPSELSPACAAVMGRIIAEVFAPAEVALFEGGPEISSALLKLPFDHIFFTGSPEIGKIVMAAAARNLASVTLELGGKSPVIVDASADIARAAKSIVWGKFINNGQTCIAPDYVFVAEKILPQFLLAAKTAIIKMYGSDAAMSPDYCRIISDRHFARVQRLLDDAIAGGAQVVTGNVALPSQKFIAPTLLTEVPADAAVLREEIFGPLLPVLPYKTLDTVIAHINDNPKPLALYVYGSDQKMIDRVISETSSGGACINMSMLHFSHARLPFGGVNNSGIGSSHGKFGFLAFSHERAVLRDRMSVTPLLYPPYTQAVKKLIKMTLRYFT